MLNKRQARYIRRAQQLKVYFAKYQETYTTYKAFDKEVIIFLSNLGAIESQLPEKDTNGTGITEEKYNQKKKVAEECSNICGFAKSYGIDIDDTDLCSAVNYKYNSILKMKDTEILGFVTRICNLLRGMINNESFADYGVTELMLTEMLADAKAFNDILGKAAVIDSESAIANKKIDTYLAAISRNVEQFDLLINYFKKSDADFVSGYKINVKLSEAGVHHSGIEGTIISAATGMPVENAVIMLAGTKKVVKSSLTGAYQLIKVRTDNYKVEVSAEGFPTKTMIIKIPRGKIVTLDVAV